jgi:hypothetical protein
MAPQDKKPRENARAERLRSALRDNVRRRKAQAKGRAGRASDEQAAQPRNSAGIAGDDTKD